MYSLSRAHTLTAQIPFLTLHGYEYTVVIILVVVAPKATSTNATETETAFYNVT